MIYVLCCQHLGGASQYGRRNQFSPGHSLLPDTAHSKKSVESVEKRRNIKRPTRGFLSSTALIFGRSFFPLFAVAIILGVIVWGPWISLAVTVVAIAATLRLL